MRVTMNLLLEIREHILNQYLKDQIPESFDDDYNLIDDGILDSLAIINLVAYLEKQYQIEFGDYDIVPEHFSSVNALAKFVQHKCTDRNIN
jgi:acyl carrier protein